MKTVATITIQKRQVEESYSPQEWDVNKDKHTVYSMCPVCGLEYGFSTGVSPDVQEIVEVVKRVSESVLSCDHIRGTT